MAEATREMEEGLVGLRQEFAEHYAKGQAARQAARQAASPTRPAVVSPKTPVASSVPVVGSTPTSSSAAPKSNFKRNLGIGAAVVALPTLAYTAYRHLTKKPETEDAHTQGKTAMLRTLGF